MFWIGIAILLITVYAMIKRYETRTVLLAAGFAMAILAGSPFAGFNAFSTRMVYGGLIEPILSAMGFAYVMKMTKCDQHLIHGLSGMLRHVRFFLVPGAVAITFFINIALISAAGTSATVGAILIPLLISMGVSPAMAGSAILMGTFGSVLSPGNPHNGIVAKIADISVMDAITVAIPATLVCLLIGAVTLTVVAVLLKEHSGYQDENDDYAMATNIKVNPLYAIVPIIPLTLLMCAPFLGDTLPWLKTLRISHCMIIGAVIGMAVTRTTPSKVTSEFFEGCGMAYASVMGIIIAAAVFTGGMDAIGLIAEFNNMLRGSESVARLAAAIGPFGLAVICGSGDAATLAFNEAVTPHAAQFGLTIPRMGELASLAGSLGRTMSPLAGAAIICAGLAKVNPMEIAKRNTLGMLIALVAAYLMMAAV